MRTVLAGVACACFVTALVVATTWCDAPDAVLLGLVLLPGVLVAAAAGQAVAHSGGLAVVAAVLAVASVSVVGTAIVILLAGSVFPHCDPQPQ
jgi:hypothetical protein